MRNYEMDLLEKLQQTSVENIQGVPVMMKHIPDDGRSHVMDPRVWKIAEQKRKMFAKRAQSGYCLSKERNRPDKVTYDLTTVDIRVEERLIHIQDDHMIDIYLYRRADSTERVPVVVYLHGGGFTAGDMRLFANQMKLIAEHSHALVVFPEYRLAPECPYPGAIEDAEGTIKWVIDHQKELHIDADKIMVAGDSAGAALTNSCVLRDREHRIKKIFEIYPAVDSSDYRKQPFYEWTYDAYPILEEQREVAYSRIDRIKNSIDKIGTKGRDSLYLQGRTADDDPIVSPVYASDEQLRQFPPIVLVSSEYDFLRISSDYFAKRLYELGVTIKCIRYCGCDHGFFDLLGTIVQAEDLCRLIGETIKDM